MTNGPGRPERWATLRNVLPDLLTAIPEQQDEDVTERIGFVWEILVGEKLAGHTRITRVTEKTLFVQVDGPEWLAPLKALDTRILEGLNRSLRTSCFTRIHYDIRPETQPPSSNKRKPKRMRHTQLPEANPTLPVDVGSLDRIADPALKETLTGLAHKFRFVALALACVVGLSNCATIGDTVPGFDIEIAEGTPDFEDSYAVRHISKLNEQNPGRYRDPRAYYHFMMDLKYEREGDFDMAAHHYAKVVEHEPGKEDFITHLMVLYLRIGKLDEALQLGQRGLRTFPDNVRMHTIVGDILTSRGRHAEALEHYRKVSELDPKSPRAFLMAGTALRFLKEYEASREWFHNVSVIDPANTLGFFYYGRSLLDTGDLPAAEEKLKKSVSLRPSMIEARQALAITLEKQEKYQEAITQYRILKKLDPANTVVADRYDTLNEAWDPVTETLTSGTQPLPELPLAEPDIHRMIGAIFYQQVMYLEAIDEFRLVLAQGEDKEVRFTIARIYEVLGRPDKAVQEIEAYRAQKDEPDTVEVLLKLARLYGLDGSMSQSVDLLGLAVNRDPHNHRLFHALTLAYMSLNRNEEALQTIDRAIALNNSHDAYYFEKGALLERMGKYEEAIANMNKALEINPNHSNAHNFIGYMYASRNIKLDRALYHLEQALSIQPRNGYFLDSLGWIYYKKGEPEKALTHIKKALIYTEPDPVLYDHLGDIYFSLENIEEARKAWKTSLVLTRQRLNNAAGEIPDLDRLESKIRNAEELLHTP
ncbi:DciA family protein [Nitrospina watsonii]|uniref:TPR_REGION domain-containing protein n=1 Tax=Nitrospina watsonii TaxID=1323948 RepID=A0ABM9HHR7_9BACT|nr:DciA family protein [Nitrospina watsonii]CAI2719605.1 TPR_REGION domain-containing protein [Nitrospina watsonii]